MCYLIMANAPNWNIENWIHLKLEQYMALLFNVSCTVTDYDNICRKKGNTQILNVQIHRICNRNVSMSK